MKVYQNNEFKNVKSINVFKDGNWQKERNAYVYHNGQWMSLIEYMLWIYQGGIEHIPLNVIMETKNIKLTYESSYIELLAGNFYNYPGLYTTLSTDKKIDITGYKNMYVEWENSAVGLNGDGCTIGISSTGEYKKEDWEASKVRNKYFKKDLDVLDVSDFIGDFYVMIEAHGVNVNSSLGVRIHKLWLE